MEKIELARSADLPKVLRDLGWVLENEGPNNWRIPGNGGLIIYREEDRIWRWSHFSEDKYGDTISFLMRFDSMAFNRAIEVLAPHGDPSLSGKSISSASTRFLPKKIDAPSEKWQESASKLVKCANNNLMKNSNLSAWRWLHERGLNDETIKKAKLGWIPEDYYGSREHFGAPPVLKDNREPRKFWVPEGLLIPVYDAEKKIVRLWVRRFNKDKPKPKYCILPGSTKRILICGKIGQPVIVCETDLDAFLINQEAGDIVTAASLGGVSTKHDIQLTTRLVVAPQILVALDADKAGRKASKWWLDTFPKAMNWPAPFKKDPGEAFGTTPGLIRSWIQAGLRK